VTTGERSVSGQTQRRAPKFTHHENSNSEKAMVACRIADYAKRFRQSSKDQTTVREISIPEKRNAPND
jgi:hypothetical protein